jgi:hypothetical protein
MFKSCITQDGDCITPYVIITTFDNTNERKCGKIDEKNEKTYSTLLKKASRAEKTIENSGLSMNLEVPIPPHPSNRDRYILWRKRNVKKYVIPQSEAVTFLQEHNYKLNVHYEAYQAIDLMNEIKKSKGLPIEEEDKSIYFDNIYTQKDQNILRRKSINCHRNIRPQVQHFENLSETQVNRGSINRQTMFNDIQYIPSLRSRSNTYPSNQSQHPSYQSQHPRTINRNSNNDIRISVYPDLNGFNDEFDVNGFDEEDPTLCKNVPNPSAPPNNTPNNTPNMRC